MDNGLWCPPKLEKDILGGLHSHQPLLPSQRKGLEVRVGCGHIRCTYGSYQGLRKHGGGTGPPELGVTSDTVPDGPGEARALPHCFGTPHRKEPGHLVVLRVQKHLPPFHHPSSLQLLGLWVAQCIHRTFNLSSSPFCLNPADMNSGLL